METILSANCQNRFDRTILSYPFSEVKRNYCVE